MARAQKYSPNQWLWDDGSHEIAWSWQNVTKSIASMRTMLQMQQPDGRIPELIFWGPMNVSDVLSIFLQYSNFQAVDITQMPVLPFSLRAIYNASRDLAVVEEFLPKLVRYFEWWASARDLDGDGLVTILHPWESGLDASPIYDLSFNITSGNVSFLELYPNFDELVITYHWQYGWNQSAILDRPYKDPGLLNLTNWFKVKDVGVNAVYARGWSVLAELASLFNSSLATYCLERGLRVESAILSKMWSPSLNRFISLYKNAANEELVAPAETVQSLFPLLLTTLPAAQQQSIVNTQLLNPSKFWLKYPVPSTSADAPQFEPVFTVDLMWRGPTWAFPNWFILEGLTYHGFWTEARTLAQKWVNLVARSGVWEMYNPLTGDPYGAIGLGMSTLVVDWIHRLNITTVGDA